MKDWIGNKNSIYKILGASNHTEKERQKNDYYATEPHATELLLEKERFSSNIWECACGGVTFPMYLRKTDIQYTAQI